jgi:hypothetical protein
MKKRRTMVDDQENEKKKMEVKEDSNGVERRIGIVRIRILDLSIIIRIVGEPENKIIIKGFAHKCGCNHPLLK